MKITAAINTYNAEADLEKVLQSVSSFDEILICDMYSTDRTLEIAKKYNATIIFHDKIPYVEPARNFLIQNAKNTWVLLLDADETVDKNLINTLKKIAEKDLSDAVNIPRKNYFLNKMMRSAFPDYNIRFFKKTKIHWPEEIHANPIIEGKIIKLPKDKKYAIEHLANDSISTILSKTNNYTNQELSKRKGKKVSLAKLFFSPLLWFFKFYIIKLGFLDGIEGFIFAKTKAHYKFYTLAKIFENNRK